MKIFRLAYIIPVVAGLGLSLGSSAWALTTHTPGDTTKSPYTISLVSALQSRRAVIIATEMVVRVQSRDMSLGCLILLTQLSNLQKQMKLW